MNKISRVSRGKMAVLKWGALLGAAAIAIVFSAIKLTAAPNDWNLAQKPLYLASSETPLMMMVMSRDERLFTKAYSDYTDLNGDGLLDTTYKNSLKYEGYFDSNLCYRYTSNRFSAAAVASNHACSGYWSGNFLNWVSMSRVDILRYVLYGGKRSTDTSTQTVLERAHIPDDLHSWVKVYSGSDIGNYVPNASGTMSFCNTSRGGPNGEPLIRRAAGAWPEWAATAGRQCINRSENVGQGSDFDAPNTQVSNYYARVQVCGADSEELREFFCREYGEDGAHIYKPAGLLQAYGESNRLRFGLLTGSYSRPRSGGVLRRNIGQLARNGTGDCAAGDEFNLSNGIFCYRSQPAGTEGIIATIDNFRLDQWKNVPGTGWRWEDCLSWGLVNRQGQSGFSGYLNNPGSSDGWNCSGWGNPIAEMYAEALRYIAGESVATPAFVRSGDLAGLPTGVNWRDPYRSPAQGGNAYCASCNILLLASSLPSFDSDEIPSDLSSIIGVTPDAATQVVGQHEGINGGTYFVGRMLNSDSPGELAVGNAQATHADVCESEVVGSLARARGICPDIPSMEGSYLVSGMAHRAATTDLRPGLQGKPASHKNTVTTYAVALADNLPKFQIPVGGGSIEFSPLCLSHPTSSATRSSNGWGSCFMGSVSIGRKQAASSGTGQVYGRQLRDDGLAGSFTFVWEDSLWGSDFDNDVVSMITYCVGAACSATVDVDGAAIPSICADVGGGCNASAGGDEVMIRVENLAAYAGYAMLTGFSVTGSDADGLKRTNLRPGNANGSLLTGLNSRPGQWERPTIHRFRLSSSGQDSRSLQTPLWYAAKYGDPRSLDSDGEPRDGLWDSRVSGQPDNYFFARDPAMLRDELEDIFEAAANQGATTVGSGAGARIGDASLTIEAGFEIPDEATDWIGYLRAFEVTQTGGRGDRLWDVADHMPSPASRRIYTVLSPTRIGPSGVVTDAVEADEFLAANLGGSESERLSALGVPVPVPTWLGATPNSGSLVNYVRGVDVGGFRDRSSMLGSIINSQPQISLPQDDFGYASWAQAYVGDPAWKLGLGEGYRAYLEAKASRNPMVYVGANDGMLHAFNASRLSGAGGGDEVFAFIPGGARSHLYELANPGYDHRYFVDGEVTVADVSFTSSGSGTWRTVLVGSTGAGGAASGGHGSVFALDVSTPGSFNAGDVLWEFNGEHDEYLGFVLGRPLVVPVAGPTGAPRWVAIFGNGPNSSNGRPVLFVVDIESGQVLSRLMPAASSYASRNGLMNLAPVAISNHYGLVDAVYGGDLQGNLWKFDLSSHNPAGWSVAFGGVPLFSARIGGQGQPITGGIEVSSGPGGGVSLFFGTGSYFAVEDRDSHLVQSLYTIWDNLSTPVSGRGALVEQVLEEGGTGSDYRFRNITASPVSYTVHRGWYVDLMIGDDAMGERFIGTPRLQSGKVIFVTYEPNESRVCRAGGGVNWEYALNMLTGAGGMSGISLTPGGDPVCEGSECAGIALEGGASGDGAPSAPVQSTNIYVPPLVPCDPSDPDCTVEALLEAEQCTFVLRAPGADPLFMPRPCGRQSWRQLR